MYKQIGKGRLGYILYLPKKESKDFPLLVYLHGAGERGTVLDHLERHAIPKMIKEGHEIDAIVLCPQCPAEFVWNNVVQDVKSLIDEIVEKYDVQKDRICITGASMGGYGTWEMGLTYHDFFAGIAPVCGGGMPWRAQNLITTPVNAFHGDCDEAVALVNSQLMVDQVLALGGNAKLHILKGFGHNDGIEQAYYHTELIEWLLRQRRCDFTPVKEALSEYF